MAEAKTIKAVVTRKSHSRMEGEAGKRRRKVYNAGDAIDVTPRELKAFADRLEQAEVAKARKAAEPKPDTEDKGAKS